MTTLFTLPTSFSPSAAIVPSTSTPAARLAADVAPDAPAPAADPASFIASRAMLVDLDVHLWTGRKNDKDAARETLDRAGANDDRGKFIKYLLASDHLKRLTGLKSRIETEHRRRTLAWLDNGGGRILSARGFDAYVTAVGDLAREFNEDAVPDFIARYPQLVNEAHRELGSLFNPAEYPTTAQLRHKFLARYTFFPVPTAHDFRVNLPQEHVDRLARTLERQVAEHERAMKAEVAERVLEVVKHMADRLAEYKPAEGGRLFGSVVDNVRRLYDLLPSLNVTDDQALADVRERLRDLTKFSTDTLKQSTAARASVATQAAAIVATVESML